MDKSQSKYYNTALLMDEALLLLLEKKDFDFITIKEVCNKAGVNRSTFYLHYENMNDLLVECLELINKRFTESFHINHLDLNNSSKEDLFFITKEFLIPYLSFVKENKRIFKLIHDKPYLFGNEKVMKKMYKEIFSVILDSYDVSDEDKPYIFAYYTQGTLSIILKWLENDCKLEIEKISTLIINLVGHQPKK